MRDSHGISSRFNDTLCAALAIAYVVSMHVYAVLPKWPCPGLIRR